MLSHKPQTAEERDIAPEVASQEQALSLLRLDGYPYGVQYYRAPTPRPDEWQGDLETLARSGYNLVQFRPQWRWHERRRGQYTWDDQDRLVELATKLGLKFIIKPMLECAPDYVFADLDGYRQGFAGLRIAPKAVGAFYVGGWLPCFDNPEVRSAAEEFVDQLVKRYGQCENLVLWNAWNEPRSRPLGECHCQHSVQAYQQYLAEQFVTVENLNDRFGKAWADFETILPPASGRDYAEMFLWRQWAMHAVSQRVDFVTRRIRKSDPNRPVMAHVGCSLIIQDAACDSSDDHANAAAVDWYGCSLPVQLHPETLYDLAGASLHCDWMRSVDEYYWVHELYPNWACWNEPPSKNVLRRTIWNVFACGAKGLVYWQYRSERVGNESNGFGLREINGAPTQRSEVSDEAGEFLGNHGKAIVEAKHQQAEVAILYSRDNDLLSRIMQLKEPLEKEEPCFSYPYKNAVHGAYLGFWALDIRADYVSTNQLDRLKDYSCIVVSWLEMVDKTIAVALEDAARNGATVIVEYPFGCREANTWVLPDRPGCGLEKLLGAREKGRTELEAVQQITLSDGTNVDVADSRVVLAPTTASVIGRWSDGSVAATVNEVGKGRVVTFGGNISIAVKEMSASQVRETWSKVMGIAGLELTSHVHGGWVGLESRILNTAEFTYLIVLNHAEHEGTICLSDKLLANGAEVIFGDSHSLDGTNLLIGSGEVRCIRIHS